MPKILITESCLVNYGDDRGGVHEPACAQPEVSKDTATKLVASGRALYVDRKDDPSKSASNTATKEMVRAAEAAVKAAAAEAAVKAAAAEAAVKAAAAEAA